ncbi:MAG: winged helix-turn-helix transcriptional regulator [Micrococcales bacterium]|nr:winged helix-turn-helix transcriptional regulator [Micrococcales bacterium]
MNAPSRDRPRGEHLARVLDAIGVLTRDFAASGRRPFPGRSLGRSHNHALVAHSRRASLTVGELAERLAVTSAAVTQLLEALRTEELVTVEVDAADRRRRVVRLTEAARAEVAAFQSRYADDLAGRFAPLTDAEVAQLDRLLGRLDDGDRRDAG